MLRVTETSYPISFRAKDARALGTHLSHHNSVVIVGMKRVGISNFLRFFLNHPGINKTYIHNGARPLFIPIDLNDLVERDIYAFWILTLKRIVDTIETTPELADLKKQSKRAFDESIQIHDLFFTVDNVQKLLAELEPYGVYPTLFFLRFDRLKDAMTPEFFSNLQGLKDAVKQRVSFVFTSFRPLHKLAPNVFPKSALSVFAHIMYLAPASQTDMTIILETFLARYQLKVPLETKKLLIAWCGGHVQYLQLALIRMKEEGKVPSAREELLSFLLADEEIALQSEELFESLRKSEQMVIGLIENHGKISHELRHDAHYVWDTGLAKTRLGKHTLFNTFFKKYIEKTHAPGKIKTELTKKEHLLFSLLQTKLGDIVEREDIVQTVWPEYAELGVSDWAIDRLIARLRTKLREQKSTYEIVTVITRGYKLTPSQSNTNQG